MSISEADKNIAAALDIHLNAMPASPPVAWENIEFTPPEGPWLRPTLLPGDTTQGSMGDDGYNEYQGLYQVSVFTPRGIGRGQALAETEKIIEHFARGTSLTAGGQSLRIRVASRLAAVVEPNWYHIPVQIAWTAHANP